MILGIYAIKDIRESDRQMKAVKASIEKNIQALEEYVKKQRKDKEKGDSDE